MNNKVKGILLVAIGASSYGVVATFIKKGLADGFQTSELTFSQAFMGALIIVLLNLVVGFIKPAVRANSPSKKDIGKLMLGGIPLGLTSTFYYLSLKYVPVSVCIVMLMQSVWMSSVIDLFVNKVKPTKVKLLAILIVLIGTVLTTNVLNTDFTLDWRGIFWGILAALSYSFTFLATNNIAPNYRPMIRSMYLLIGSLIIVSLVWGHSLYQSFDPSVLWKWGFILAFFGTILPPLLFTKGMPLIGVGLGGIVASAELPVSVLMAYFFIHEQVDFIQWVGIALILCAIVLMNISFIKNTNSN